MVMNRLKSVVKGLSNTAHIPFLDGTHTHLHETRHDDVDPSRLRPLRKEPVALLQLEELCMCEDGLCDLWFQPREPGEVLEDGGRVGRPQGARGPLQVLHLLLYRLEEREGEGEREREREGGRERERGRGREGEGGRDKHIRCAWKRMPK